MSLIFFCFTELKKNVEEINFLKSLIFKSPFKIYFIFLIKKIKNVVQNNSEFYKKLPNLFGWIKWPFFVEANQDFWFLPLPSKLAFMKNDHLMLSIQTLNSITLRIHNAYLVISIFLWNCFCFQLNNYCNPIFKLHNQNT